MTHVFGIVSVHNLPIYDAISRRERITLVRCRHEQAATHAADGFARATGRLGVVLASSGPGTTNTVSGLYEAQFGSSPVLLVTGQIESRFLGKGKGFLHEAERQAEMLRTVTRRVETVRRTEDIGAGARPRWPTTPASGRPQPVAVEIPIDLQYATRRRSSVPAPHEVARLAVDRDALERAADAARRRPSGPSSGPAAAWCPPTRPPRWSRWPSGSTPPSSRRSRGAARSPRTTAWRSAPAPTGARCRASSARPTWSWRSAPASRTTPPGCGSCASPGRSSTSTPTPA